MPSLTTHLHQFVIENQLTENEFAVAVDFIIGIGQATGPQRNEVILAADLLGVTTLVALLNNPAGAALKEESRAAARVSHTALLGPFRRADAPQCAPAQSIVRSAKPGATLEVQGTV